MTKSQLKTINSRASRYVLARCVLLMLLGVTAVFGMAGCGHETPDADGKKSTTAAASSISHYEANQNNASSGSTARFIAAEPLPKPTEPMAEGATCVTPGCHTKFMSQKQIHGPVAVANCESCHEQDTGEHVFPLKREGNQTCLFCHPVIGMRSHEHEAVETSGCTACHDPHCSDTKFLLTEPSVEQLCSSCHQIPLKKYAHGPFAAGQCTVCHEPHEANAENLLRQGEQPDHCFSCHTGIQVSMANSPFVHEPAKTGCTTCHDAHTSENPFHLSQPIAQGCFSCHDGMAKRIETQPVSHDALFIDDACANCHNPHAAGGQALLQDRTDKLCMQCHDKPVIAADGHTVQDMQATLNKKYLHGPIRSGDCAACHSVHGGENARLLVKAFPDSFYASFDLTNYALCFSCHSADLVLTEKTDSLTGFRQGDQNLHYVHVHKDEKGRTCKTCHDIHGSDRPDHIASDVPFEGSNWAMPINFSRTETGGSCSPGCHEPKEYIRGQTVDSPNTNEAPSQGGPS